MDLFFTSLLFSPPQAQSKKEEEREEAESGGRVSSSSCRDVVSCLSGPRCQRRGLCRGAGRGARGSSSHRGRGRRSCRNVIGVVVVVGGGVVVGIISLRRSLLCAPLGAPVLEQQGTWMSPLNWSDVFLGL